MRAEPINLLGLDGTALTSLVAQWGGKPFRAKQVQRWVHQHGVCQFQDMTDLAKEFRSQLDENCLVQAPTVLTDKASADGTRKWLFDVGDNNAIETVFIPEDDRGTLCISSQAGCAVNCRFCSTGHQGFNRNLNTAEIIGQLWWANSKLRESGNKIRLDATSLNDIPGMTSSSDRRVISNVVMMGMGEPLLNYDALLPALKLMLDDNAYGLSRRRVTVSTSGVVPMMDRLAKDCPVALAVSLHAPNDELRDHLVPLNKKYPLDSLLEACERYLEFAPRDFITFEYVMLDGVNDSDDHAKQLISLARRIHCKFNLIPFNPFTDSGLKRSSDSRIRSFSLRLLDAGIVTTVRKTRGDDIDAACGQLAGQVRDRTRLHEKKSRKIIIPIKELTAS